MRLTVDAAGDRVLSLESKRGDAWRMKIETYHTGRWQSRLKAAAHPRPWLERCRALVTFTGTLPKQRLEKIQRSSLSRGRTKPGIGPAQK
jgi:hypothetical protein